jgi:TPR repeat protein
VAVLVLVSLSGGPGPEQKAENCGKDDPSACFDSALAFASDEKVSKDSGRAAALYQRGCDVDHAGSCNNLARLIDEGEGVPKDVAHAVRLYAKACRLGSDVACRNSAISYVDGYGAPDAPTSLAGWLRLCKAATDELVTCGAAAMAFDHGVGTTADLSRAGELYGTACERGHARSCRTLGQWYRAGRQVPHDDVRAQALLDRACDQGNTDACVEAGRAYRDGTGVARDTARAAQLLRKACRADSRPGCSELNALCAAGEVSACPGADTRGDAAAE